MGCFAATFSYAQTIPPLAATRLASGLAQPLFATAPPGDYNRLFIVQKTGQILILNLPSGTVNTTPFLDLSATIETTSEQGMLGLAFDPDYASNGKFYLNFVVPGGFWGNGTTHISQFQVSADPNVASVSEKILLTFDHPETNHNGGWIGLSNRSGDDHNLYIATGDGGNGDDADGGTGHIEPGGNAQNTTTLLGKLLRIHVDAITGTTSIPSNNPFFGAASPTRQEIFCYGLRNPFRNSFDRLTKQLYIGDVGQGSREEVDVQQVANPGGGENYGWRVREGLIQNPTYPNDPVPAGVTNPIIDYPHSGSGITGNCVTGGYVYRGKQIPGLRGTYVFGDYVASKILTLNYDGATASNFQDITAQLFPTVSGGFSLSGPASFGEDANGELYVCSLNNGALYRILPLTPNVTIDSVSRTAGGPFVLKGTGVPFSSVTIKSTGDLTQQFNFLATVVATADGTYEYDDSISTSPQFYRVTYP